VLGFALRVLGFALRVVSLTLCVTGFDPGGLRGSLRRGQCCRVLGRHLLSGFGVGLRLGGSGLLTGRRFGTRLLQAGIEGADVNGFADVRFADCERLIQPRCDIPLSSGRRFTGGVYRGVLSLGFDCNGELLGSDAQALGERYTEPFGYRVERLFELLVEGLCHGRSVLVQRL
jgi:hypothetical protein